MQVGRRRSPLADAGVVVGLRRALGPAVTLRADANRKWSLQQAVAFGTAAASAHLQVSCISVKWTVSYIPITCLSLVT